MDYPDDLPSLIEYSLGQMADGTPKILVAMPRRPIEMRGSSGKHNADIVHPQIPVGTLGWRPMGDTQWYSLESIPEHWLPFLQRERPGPLDPRPRWWEDPKRVRKMSEKTIEDTLGDAE